MREADVVVAAVGVPHLVTAAMVKPGAAVIDVGINRTDDGLVGDVHPEVADVARVPHARAGRRRPDDDRHAARRHGARGHAPTGPGCGKSATGLELRPLLFMFGGSVPGPSFGL